MNNLEKEELHRCLFISWHTTFYIAFILGWFMFIQGCDTGGHCFLFEPVVGTAFQYEIQTHTCKACTHWEKKSRHADECTEYVKYTCYNSKVHFHFDSDNSTCFVQTSSDVLNETSANQANVERFSMGEEVDLFHRIDSHRCYEQGETNIEQKWLIGIICIGWTVIWVLVTSIHCYKINKKYTQMQTQANTIVI